MKNIAVILGGGQGTRTNLHKPKQFIKFSGHLVIEYSMIAFNKHTQIDEVIVVVPDGFQSTIRDIINKNNLTKITEVLIGGSTRQESSFIAINYYYNKYKEANILLHDAARPLIDASIIDRCLHALDTYSAVDVTLPVTDTIVKINKEKNTVENFPQRSLLHNGQTPQGFKLSLIFDAHQKALKDKSLAELNDDCGILSKYLPNLEIALVSGSRANIKLTHLEDIEILDSFLKLKSLVNFQNLGHNAINDTTHKDFLKNRVLVIFGGSSGIGKEIKKLAELSYGMHVYSFSRSNQTDITNVDHVRCALESVRKKHPLIHDVVVTSGILLNASLEETSYEEINNIVNTNYLGSIIVAKESLPYLKESKGSITFFSSSSYARGRGNLSIYSSSKAAIINFSQAIHEEWLDYNIHVSCIVPDRTSTPMRKNAFKNENTNTLLNPEKVALYTLQTIAQQNINNFLHPLRKL
jgi:2-C-methyl-D-erythritol 4-phosphate cytidylyltransferase